MYKPKNYDYSKFVTLRNTDIYILRKAGWKYEALAIRHGISKERVRQIFEKYQDWIDRGYIEDPTLESSIKRALDLIDNLKDRGAINNKERGVLRRALLLGDKQWLT